MLLALATVGHGTQATPTPPVFPTQWSAHTYSIVKQGISKQILNCDFAFDYENNRTAYRNCHGNEQIVSLYDDDSFGTFGKHYYIGPPGGRYPTGMCQYWCDASGDIIENMEETLMSYDYEHRAKYDTSTTLQGPDGAISVDVFKWQEPLVIVSMADQHLYVFNESVPVYRHHDLHPFEKHLGDIYTNYTKFVAGPPDAAMFDIPNLKYCERGDDSQCPDGGKTRHTTPLVLRLLNVKR